LRLERCLITANQANDGGGIWNNGALALIDSTVAGNLADRDAPPGYECGSGGGIKTMRVGPLYVEGSTISGNQAKAKGGGIFVACFGRAVLVNSTVSGNRAATFGGGLGVKGALELQHVTVAQNQAPRGKGAGLYVWGTLDYAHSIVADNPLGGDCLLFDGGYRGTGTVGQNDLNLVEDGGCAAELAGDPGLKRLDTNGGLTRTQALDPLSPAVDAVAPLDCGLSVDQRGEHRPAGAGCDLGAVEVAQP
jgi:hypothetical protein